MTSPHYSLRAVCTASLLCGLLVATGCRSAGMGWLGWGGKRNDDAFASSLPGPTDSAEPDSVDTAAIKEVDPSTLDGVPDGEGAGGDAVADTRGVQNGQYNTQMPGGAYPQESGTPAWGQTGPAYTADARNGAAYTTADNYSSNSPAYDGGYNSTNSYPTGNYNTGGSASDSYNNSYPSTGSQYEGQYGGQGNSQYPTTSGSQYNQSSSGYTQPAYGNDPASGSYGGSYDSSGYGGSYNQPADSSGGSYPTTSGSNQGSGSYQGGGTYQGGGSGGSYQGAATQGSGSYQSPANYQTAQGGTGGGNAWSNDYPTTQSSGSQTAYAPGSTSNSGSLQQYQQDPYSSAPQGNYASPYPTTQTR